MDTQNQHEQQSNVVNNLMYNLHQRVHLINTPDISTVSYNPIPVNTSVPSSGPAKKRASFTACSACQSKHCACDEQRPCSRCVRLRIVCSEGVPRRGKTKKKPQKEAPVLNSPDPYVTLERELLAGKYPSSWPTPSSSSRSIPQPLSVEPSTPSTLSYPASPSSFPLSATPETPFLAFELFATTSGALPSGDVYDLNTDTSNLLFPTTATDFMSFSPTATPSQQFRQSTPSQPTSSPAAADELSSSSSSGSSSPVPSADSFAAFMHPPEAVSRTFTEQLALTNPQAAISLAQSSLHPFSAFIFPSTSDCTSSTPSSKSSTPSSSAPHATMTMQNSPHYPPPSSSTSAPTSIFSSSVPNLYASSPTSSSPSKPATASDLNHAMMQGLQQELLELRKELASVRQRERTAFPLHQRVMPRDYAMTLWSLSDGTILDYSAGFLKLLNYTSQIADKLSFYDISPNSTRAQRRHLLAYFLRERPEVNGVVTYKSILHSSGNLLDVLCTSTVFYFEDNHAIIQLVFFKP